MSLCNAEAEHYSRNRHQKLKTKVITYKWKQDLSKSNEKGINGPKSDHFIGLNYNKIYIKILNENILFEDI